MIQWIVMYAGSYPTAYNSKSGILNNSKNVHYFCVFCSKTGKTCLYNALYRDFFSFYGWLSMTLPDIGPWCCGSCLIGSLFSALDDCFHWSARFPCSFTWSANLIHDVISHAMDFVNIPPTSHNLYYETVRWNFKNDRFLRIYAECFCFCVFGFHKLGKLFPLSSKKK